MKKIVTLLLTLGIFLGILTGCNSKEEEKNVSKAYPNETITLIVPTGAGGGTDLAARIWAKYASEKMGVNIVVSNVTGVYSVGLNQVRTAAPDGYTVLFHHNTAVLGKISGTTDFGLDVYESGPGFVYDAPCQLYVNSKSDIKTIDDLVAKLKANPESLSICSEVGAYTYYEILGFQEATGTKFNIIDVGGNADKITALLGGHVDVMPNAWSTVSSYVENGDFIALGIPTEEQLENVPGVKTFKEQGIDYNYPGYSFGFWFPKNTPAEVINLFDKVTEEIAKDPEVKKEIEDLGYTVQYMSAKEKEEYFDKLRIYYEELAETVK